MRKERITQQQAQAVWDSIRCNVRLAKFNDAGIELPAIDMQQIFNGRKSVTLSEVTTEILSIIEKWKPSL